MLSSGAVSQISGFFLKYLLQKKKPISIHCCKLKGSGIIGIDSDNNEASVMSSMETASPPQNGRCTLMPPSGRALQTRFTAACSGFENKRTGLTTYSFKLITQGTVDQNCFENKGK